ncbi:SEC1 family transport protein SLY1 [Hibiscus syriacus]|uniref:SEC1 family transport protein SLY1 n=1 Tax=Hibiscus syriacus TaxID=106335 RepID=A0A6A3CC54_HIBSY|nr:SEC1 family transport protein SLY1 [Hibiscus syriacus]
MMDRRYYPNELLAVLKGKGTKMDKLRFAITYIISSETINPAEAEAVEAALIESEVDTSAFQTVEALMEGKPNPEIDSYLVFDPCAPKSSSGSSSSHLKGPFKEAIVFTFGGGNYVEYGSLQNLAQHQQPVKHVIYGTTEILTGMEFVEQLSQLGNKMGLGNSVAISSATH